MTRARSIIATLLAGVALALTASAACAGATRMTTEQLFADWLDAGYAQSTLAAGSLTRIEGRDLAYWRSRRQALGQRLKARLDHPPRSRRAPGDRRAWERMRQGLAEAADDPVAVTSAEYGARCDTAADPALSRSALSQALYGCFEHLGDHIPFEGQTIARATALELLQQLDSPARRRTLFEALGPLWRKINADDAPDSPYRRLIALTRARTHGGSEVDKAAAALGLTPDQAEADLVAVLAAWRAANPGPPIEPWDYWSHYAAAVAPLDALIPPARIVGLSAAYYRDLGLDLDRQGVIQDLGVRPGKAPLAYADFVRIGRATPRGWRPARMRVSANVERGGLFVLNEIVHEDGHVLHMSAIRARPAWFDLGDDLFLEAFADVPSWSVAAPAWQSRYLGLSLDADTARRALLANVMLDLAWGLFELRLLKDPAVDPNALWTEITRGYLNIAPHPDLAWWAMRVQLVEEPGYMVNYGLGAILTADLRQRFKARIGDFDAGNRRFYPYASSRLLRFGAERPTPALLRDFLGRPVSAQPLLDQIRALSAPSAP